MAARTLGGRWLGTLLMAALFGLAACADARGQEERQEPWPVRVRAADQHADALLRRGRDASPTFREMLELLEHSDLIVHVETRAIALPGQIQLVAATPGCRYLRVSVRTPGLDTEQTAWLAHELWHAVEIAGAADVRDQASLQRLYKRIGRADRYGDTAESAAAQEAWTKVLGELRSVR